MSRPQKLSLGRQMLAVMPLAALRSQADPSGGLKRTLTAVDLVFLGVGVILGTGVFVVTGQAAAAHAGPAVTLSFVLAGLAAALAALCYAELAAVLPVAGSAYAYTYATLGELAGFLIGWTLALEWLVSAALVTVGWSGYFVVTCERLWGWRLPTAWAQAPWAWDSAAGQLVATGAWANLPAIGIGGLVAAVLVRGVDLSARLNQFFVLVKLAVILLFVTVGVQAINPANWRPFLPPNAGGFGHFGISGLLQGTTLVYLSFIGFDAVSTAAQEAKNPQRDVPIGTLVPVAICTFIYVGVALVLTGMVPTAQLAVPYPLALAAAATGHAWLETCVALGATVGLCSCVMGAMMAQPRIFMAMSRDGLLPAALARLHPRHRTPHVATWLCGGICMLLGGLVPVDVLGEMASVGTLVIFLWVSVAVILLRRRQPDAPRRFRVPGGAFGIPLASVLMSCLLLATARAQTLEKMAAYLFAGVLIYLGWGRRHSRLPAILADFSGPQASGPQVSAPKVSAP